MTAIEDYMPGDPAKHVIGKPEEKPARVHRPPPPKPNPNATAILADIRLRKQELEGLITEYHRLIAADEALRKALGKIGQRKLPT